MYGTSLDMGPGILMAREHSRHAHLIIVLVHRPLVQLYVKGHRLVDVCVQLVLGIHLREEGSDYILHSIIINAFIEHYILPRPLLCILVIKIQKCKSQAFHGQVSSSRHLVTSSLGLLTDIAKNSH